MANTRPLRERCALLGLFMVAADCVCALPAFAASAVPSGAAEGTGALFLVQLSLLMLLGRLLGEVAQRIGQPSVIGQLAAGVLLGPSIFGLLWPTAHAALFPENAALKSMFDAVSQLGIILLLLITGMEVDLKLVRKVRQAAFSASLGGIALPFALGFAVGELVPAQMLPNPDLRLVTSLFLGTALSISSVKVVAMVVKEMDFTRRNLGQVMIAAAIIDDTIGWIIIAMIFAIAQNGPALRGALVLNIAALGVFLFVSLRWGGRAVSALIRIVNDNFVSDMAVITAILMVTFGFALMTDAIGAHTALGAFIAGVLIGQSPILTGHIEAQLRGLIVALFMPVFFGLAGLSVNLEYLAAPAQFALFVGLVAIASFGKFAGAGIGGYFGGLSRRESLTLALGLNARGSTEVIVATIGLSLGALNPSLFTMIVSMAIVTTMLMPPSLRWALRRVPMGEEERARLEREASEEQGFVATLERFLVAADESASGLLASRIAGLLAGARQKLVTVVALSRENDASNNAEHAAVVANETARRVQGDESDAKKALPADVTILKPKDPPLEAVGTEAAKGYDLLLIGIDKAANGDGGILPEASKLAAGFKGCLALTIARSNSPDNAQTLPLEILVPITGNPASRRAAETAIILAEVAGATVTGVYIVDVPPATLPRKHRSALAQDEKAILQEFATMAQVHGVQAKTKVRRSVSVEEAILTETQSAAYSLLLVGASRRPGEDLFFGNRAKSLVQRCPISIMVLSS